MPCPVTSDSASSSSSCSVPLTPYSIEMPYSSMPEASAPRMKYFIAASDDSAASRFIATIAYSDSDSSSSPRYTVSMLFAEISTSMPIVANSERM